MLDKLITFIFGQLLKSEKRTFDSQELAKIFFIFFLIFIGLIHMLFAKEKVGVVATYCPYQIQKTQPRSLGSSPHTQPVG